MGTYRYQDQHGEADPVYATADTADEALALLEKAWSDYIGRINEKGDYDEIAAFNPELARPVADPANRWGPRPTCCKKIQTLDRLRHVPTVLLEVHYDYLKSEDKSGEGPHPPRWVLAGNGMRIKYCPFCGSKLPKVKPSSKPPQPLCVVTDGGYYCETCNERLNACECHHPAAAYKITKQKKRAAK